MAHCSPIAEKFARDKVIDLVCKDSPVSQSILDICEVFTDNSPTFSNKAEAYQYEMDMLTRADVTMVMPLETGPGEEFDCGLYLGFMASGPDDRIYFLEMNTCSAIWVLPKGSYSLIAKKLACAIFGLSLSAKDK